MTCWEPLHVYTDVWTLEGLWDLAKTRWGFDHPVNTGQVESYVAGKSQKQYIWIRIICMRAALDGLIWPYRGQNQLIAHRFRVTEPDSGTFAPLHASPCAFHPRSSRPTGAQIYLSRHSWSCHHAPHSFQVIFHEQVLKALIWNM